jgi:hypothetical protein
MKRKKRAAIAAIPQRHPRHRHLAELSLTYEGRTDSVCIRPPDISAKGMFINTDAAFPEGSVLKLSFRLARTGARIAARCEVRYCLPGVGVGVEFIGLPFEHAQAIEKEIRTSGLSVC